MTLLCRTVARLGLVCVFTLGGCSGPAHKPAQFMQEGVAAPTAAVPGKSLVCIHRPPAHGGRFVKTGIWDGAVFVGALGSGQSLAYVCDPGQHYLASRSFDQVSVVEAQLLSDKIYDLRVETGGVAPSLKLKPMKKTDKERREVAEWSKGNFWVSRDPSAATYEEAKRGSTEKLIQDFVSGSKRDRLEHLASEDHR
jgi:hypothetical protein